MSNEEKANAILENTTFRMKMREGSLAEPDSETRNTSISKVQRKILLSLVGSAITRARATAYMARRAEGSEQSEYIESIINITDAMHNVPRLLAEDSVDIQYLRWCFSEIGMEGEIDKIFE